ncbi:MAG TPA: phasin family protein [Steroidobacteraceae bacterium]|jgi:poly(hydroxyalkanoate) granule-associated protein|nr:phasin family protein [Steroidobacteraceae bacterium]
MAARKKGKRKSTPAKGTMAQTIDTGHRIWLAGLGALVRTQREGPKLFNTLVEEGSAIEQRQRTNAQHLIKGAWDNLRETVDDRTAGVRTKASETIDNLEEIFQNRVQKALQQLGMPTSHEIGALSRKVNELNRSVQALTRSKTSAARKPAAPASEADTAPF